MRAGGIFAVLAGVVVVGAAVLWAVLAGDRVMPSYLAAWLIWAGLPIGALVLVLLLEIGGGAETLSVLTELRLLALGLPIAALLFIPMLVLVHPLYAWAGGDKPGAPFGDAWMHPAPFIGRAIAFLVILSAFALLFARPRLPGERRTLALFALFIVALVLTLAATDWVMSLDPSLHSGEFGLLITSTLCCVALCGAVLFLPVPTRGAVLLLASASAVWAYLHFMQYLVMWSGDLPKEVSWYLMRDADAGRTIEWIVFALGAILPVGLLLLPWPLQAAALAPVALLALAAHMLEALWFVTPVFRHHFALRGPDVLMLLGLGAVMLGLAALRAFSADAELPDTGRGVA